MSFLTYILNNLAIYLLTLAFCETLGIGALIGQIENKPSKPIFIGGLIYIIVLIALFHLLKTSKTSMSSFFVFCIHKTHMGLFTLLTPQCVSSGYTPILSLNNMYWRKNHGVHRMTLFILVAGQFLEIHFQCKINLMMNDYVFAWNIVHI